MSYFVSVTVYDVIRTHLCKISCSSHLQHSGGYWVCIRPISIILRISFGKSIKMQMSNITSEHVIVRRHGNHQTFRVNQKSFNVVLAAAPKGRVSKRQCFERRMQALSPPKANPKRNKIQYRHPWHQAELVADISANGLVYEIR